MSVYDEILVEVRAIRQILERLDKRAENISYIDLCDRGIVSEAAMKIAANPEHLKTAD